MDRYFWPLYLTKPKMIRKKEQKPPSGMVKVGQCFDDKLLMLPKKIWSDERCWYAYFSQINMHGISRVVLSFKCWAQNMKHNHMYELYPAPMGIILPCFWINWWHFSHFTHKIGHNLPNAMVFLFLHGENFGVYTEGRVSTQKNLKWFLSLKIMQHNSAWF